MTNPDGHVTRPLAGGPALERTLFEVKKVVVGQDQMVERMLVGLLARGHVLLEGVPGVAKTLAVRTLAEAIGGTFKRLQFTPDLMPGDIVGTRVWRPSSDSFDTELGPIFANLVLADEINRAPAKVQSALLEAMAERQVTIGGRTFALPAPFLVLATQNPIESEGVYQLPEAQRDRFLLKVDVGYPSDVEELTILQRMSVDPPRAHLTLELADVEELQRATDRVFVHHAVAQYAVALVIATREPHRFGLGHLDGVIDFGVSPRATLGLVAAGRALALLRGRDYVLPGDVADIAPDVLSHRLVLSFEAVADGADPRALVGEVLGAVRMPEVAPGQHDSVVGATGHA
ncbi:AAA family ATPase [Knoellia sp. CPCC 206435]|uniref:AAA family ATPase n=1 Tax=Knoellia terrae TaxID=3404797 RepID=UPI003B428992